MSMRSVQNSDESVSEASKSSSSSSSMSSSQSTLTGSFCFGEASKEIRAETRPMSRRRKFIMFTRLLFKILKENEMKDPGALQKAKDTLKDCASSTPTRSEQGHRKPLLTMETRLREEVGEKYWYEALHRFILLSSKQLPGRKGYGL
eukprot:scaffold125923_cov59-Attheya_sp.AAC.2